MCSGLIVHVLVIPRRSAPGVIVQGERGSGNLESQARAGISISQGLKDESAKFIRC